MQFFVVFFWLMQMGVVAESSDYLREIQPLFKDRCYRCHGPEKQKGGLRLDSKASVFRGGDSGMPAISAGHSRQSLLVRLTSSSDDEERMPPPDAKETPLSQKEFEIITSWIDSGAEWPESSLIDSEFIELQITQEDREHWSFVPISKNIPPIPKDSSWQQTPVDAFIRQAHEKHQMTPSKPADARVLVRRLFMDLIGLPPTPKEVDDWVGKIHQSQAAVDLLVETLLNSPHYGERWARHWLDVARYADSNGMEIDADRPNAYRYRDFVIRALNDDLPFDTFVRWQLAGDEIAPGNPDAIAATGFIAAGVNTILPDMQMVEEKLRNRANELDDMVSTTGQAMLGLTLACARCHDHKYDPLPTRDYYRLTRIFTSGDRAEVPLVSPSKVADHQNAISSWEKAQDQVGQKRDRWFNEAKKTVEARLHEDRVMGLDISDDEKRLLIDHPEESRAKKIADRFKKALAISREAYLEFLPTEAQVRWKEFSVELDTISKQKPEPLPMAYAFADFGPEPAETWFFERGNFMARNEKMDFGFLSVLTSGKSADDYWSNAQASRRRDDSTQQRSALADWITDLDHGAGALLARVMVNRVWQRHFGEGLVRTPSDFGIRGERPTHPALLDWLAGEFIMSGWSIKHLHRLMLKSAAYQQSSEANPTMASIDPDNRLLWRQRPARLEAEILRDAMLSIAGSLNLEALGPSFKPPIQKEAMQARNVKNPYPKEVKDSSGTRRRSIYMFHKRVVQYPLMQAFDAPDAQQSCGRRMNTTVAPQALALLNDPFVRLRAGELASRIQHESEDDLESQVERAFHLALNRDPDVEELNESRLFLKNQTDERVQRGDVNGALSALTDFCHALFGLNEFIYID
ncbi:PSD1 and planctomycete cytochrome C domain-containing protein [bacterium]|nr:PSD1 and planctomycete cytochrome C domain-containing protein [bacterium]